MCRRCPVLRECRAFALRNSEYDGVWGGMTAGERRAGVRGGSEDRRR
ncbi:WhiB family transcriptional regulator [Streptomyces spiralis]